MRIIAGILTAGLIAGLTAAAHAETEGWYLGAEAGVNLVPKTKFKDGTTTKFTNDTGYAILGQLGYGFGQYRVEGEIGWRANGVSKLTEPVYEKAGGNFNASSFMVNGLYDIPTASRFTPYVGIGVGGVDVWADKIRAGGVGLTKDSDFVFGYQGILGASYAINDNLSLKGDYHYLRTLDAKLNDEAPLIGSSKGVYQAHTFAIGFVYKFGAPAKPVAAAAAPYVAPAPAPAPAPAVKAAPIAKNYLVFFDFDKANITPEADRIISQAASNAKTSNATSISLVGHTDAAGSAKYNQALSLRRANAVKEALVKQGIPANEISVVGRGKSDQLVATKDGVREPQNRRVQIVLP